MKKEKHEYRNGDGSLAFRFEYGQRKNGIRYYNGLYENYFLGGGTMLKRFFKVNIPVGMGIAFFNDTDGNTV